MLDLFSFKIGFGTKHYQFQGGTIQTATQYTGEKQDLVQNAAKEMICVEKALKEVTRAVLWIGRNVLGANCNPDSKITVIADDSYIIDQDSERKRWQEEININVGSGRISHEILWGNRSGGERRVKPNWRNAGRKAAGWSRTRSCGRSCSQGESPKNSGENRGNPAE